MMTKDVKYLTSDGVNNQGKHELVLLLFDRWHVRRILKFVENY